MPQDHSDTDAVDGVLTNLAVDTDETLTEANANLVSDEISTTVVEPSDTVDENLENEDKVETEVFEDASNETLIPEELVAVIAEEKCSLETEVESLSGRPETDSIENETSSEQKNEDIVDSTETNETTLSTNNVPKKED